MNDEKRKELLLVAKKLKSLKEYEKVYIQKDLTFRQRQELYEWRYGRGVLQSGNRAEIAKDGNIDTVFRDVGRSLAQDGCLDRNVVRGGVELEEGVILVERVALIEAAVSVKVAVL